MGGETVVRADSKIGSAGLAVDLSKELGVTSIESYKGILLQMQLAHV